MEPPDTDRPPMSRAEWAACILMALGLALAVVLVALRMWRAALVAASFNWSGVYLMGRTLGNAPQVVHNHQGAKPTPRV